MPGRALIGAFAEEVRTDGGLPVADLGCGPGHVTAHLAGLGLDAHGVDASSRMVETARRRHPEVRFETGEMDALALPDGGLGGIVAWWSILHTPPDRLPGLFAEFRRVLAPGGRLLLGFHAGNGEPYTSRKRAGVRVRHPSARARRGRPAAGGGGLRRHRPADHARREVAPGVPAGPGRLHSGLNLAGTLVRWGAGQELGARVRRA